MADQDRTNSTIIGDSPAADTATPATQEGQMPMHEPEDEMPIQDAELGMSPGSQARLEPQYQPTETGRTYIVKDGDTLRTIAAECYGSGDHWERIFQANQDKLSNPDMLYPGQELALP